MEEIAHILFLSRPDLNQDMSLRQLRQLCQKSGAQLTLLEVLEPVSQNLFMSEKVLASQLESKLIEHAETNLKLIAEDFIQAGVKTDTVVVKGKPVIEVLRQVNELSVDLLMLNAESESNLKQRIFGSTALHLIRKCPCPVWAIKSTCYYPMRNIMGAVDLNPDDDDRQRSNLNPDIARTTVMLADLLGTPAHLVQAWKLDNEAHLQTRGGLDDRTLERLHRDMQRHYESRMANFCTNVLSEQQTKIKTHVVHGTPAHVVAQQTDYHNIDLLVMGTLSRQGILGMLIGNTAEDILNSVDCSVLALKPPGFVCPVKSD
ncbi:universal stress protein [Lacimicrobium alkaliphilum]|uniref:Universal stress protein n=1 Tax=Lacimicrobium alkaliphilum TaxID=1526571 RepID=A0ABQ1RID8_9ALTE|nr:universal stress protein [Lacimicrobium alkaliphilum]GGD69221.1 universal stress protein [Lacimicrobium alkaliphilum]